MARKQKARAAKLWQAPQVEEVARGVIEKSHKRLLLNGCALRYAFQQRMPKQYRREVAATVAVIGGKAAALAAGLPDSAIPIEKEEQFFLITFGWGWWSQAKPERRQAEVDAALCYCGTNDKGGLVIWPPDVIGHREAIARHGLYSHDLKELGKTVQHALPLEDEVPVVDRKAAAAADKAAAEAEHLADAKAAGLLNTMTPEEATALVAEGKTTEAALADFMQGDGLTDAEREQAALDAEPSRIPGEAERNEEAAAQEAEAGRRNRRGRVVAPTSITGAPLAH